MQGAGIHGTQARPPSPVGGEKKYEGGLRTRECCKNNPQGKPPVSIVTVVFNGAPHLEATIQSVVSQTCANIEYIIIDGGSTDGTLDIIKKYENQIHYWMSGKDAGIYDAMNKGVALTSGEWINFMNAGDCFLDSNVVESIFSNEEFIESSDVIYGDSMVVYPDLNHMRKIRMSGRIEELWKGMQFSHQSMFVSAGYAKRNKFSLANTLASDFEFIYAAYKQKKRFIYTGKVISIISAGGASDINRVRSCRERLRIVSKSGGYGFPGIVVVYLYYALSVINILVTGLVKYILPSVMIKKIMQIKQQ